MRRRLLIIISMLLWTMVALAQFFEVDGILYLITSTENLTVAVTRGGRFTPRIKYSGDIFVIPASIQYDEKTYSVTSIDSYTFSGCRLTSVSIPNSVTSIGEGAFRDCGSLASITIPNSVTTIGIDAFSGTAWYNNQEDGLLYLDDVLLGYKGEKPTGSLEIKEGTRIIACPAFSGCSRLTSVTIPNSVTSIGDHAFSGCSRLTSVTIPNSVTSIGDHAFT